MREQISEKYLLSIGCNHTSENIEQGEWRECFELEGYDCTLIISPMPDGSCYIDKNGEWLEMPINDNFEITHTDDWQIFCNSFENHLATFHYQDEIEALLKLTHAPTSVRSD